ncbi:MAG: tyrosine-type recombinase/integrase [Acidobacteriia bacterium]|nr:tyrosine-type recombinase/integrase [Terriglobia bacterium]
MKNESEVKHRGVYERDPGSGVWWIRWHDGQGRRHREKVGSKAAAIKLAEKRRVEVREGKLLPELHRRAVTFGEIAADALEYSEKHKRSYGDDKSRMPRLLAWWKDRPADSLTPEEFAEKLGSVKEWADATRNRIRALLSLTYKLAIRHRKVKENPARLVAALPEGNPRQGFVIDSQYSKLAQACPTVWLRAMLAVGYTFGWRVGELTNLRVRQVDLAARTVRLEPGTTKNMEGRTIKLTGECYELVKACIGDKDSAAYLFTRADGKPVRTYRGAWEQLCVRAGLGRFICRTCKGPGPATGATGRCCPTCAKAGQVGIFRYEGLLFHDLRRSAVRNLERSAVPRSVAMKITGHKTEAVYRRYAIVSEADLAEAIERLERSRLDYKNEGAPQGAPASSPQVEISAKLM